mmetsp:Transcript_101176/g.325983  ORF Transcript_101176/g.325983 Transcript_101176/m.325983 type:complete len:248 (-) Transcript_101176:16-759(-)
MSASLVETIKATEPVPSVIFAAILMGEGWAPATEQIALAVVVTGVMLMSYAESTFQLSGLLATLSANFNFALGNNISKVSFARIDRLDPLNFWYRTVQVSAIIALPAALAEVRANGFVPASMSFVVLLPVALLNGCSFFLYNQATCVILDNVKMSVHAVLNSARRAVLIAATALYFGSGFSWINLLGAAVAFVGFAFYLSRKFSDGAAAAEAAESTSAWPAPAAALVALAPPAGRTEAVAAARPAGG